MIAGLLAAVATLALLSGLRTRRHGAGATPVPTSPEPSPGRRARRAAARRRERQVPQLLDLLATGASAGLSAELSMRRAADALAAPLGPELAHVFARVDLGARWRDELAAFAERHGSRDLQRALAVLARADELGASLVDATHDLAASVRAARRAETLRRARTAPVKMLFPLVFLILPAFLLLTVVPVLLTTVRSIG